MDKDTVRRFISACKHGEMDVIDRLIEQGIDVNCKHNDKTALRMACRNEEPYGIDVVTKLIVHGADVDYEDCESYNALDQVLSQETFNSDLAYLLLDCSKLGINRLDKGGRNYLWSIKTIEACKFLVDNGININHVNNKFRTYVDGQVTNLIRYLIKQGAKKYDEL